MFKKIIEYYNGFDKITSLILKHGLNFCFLISIISTIILITYNMIFNNPYIYYIGIGLFRLSLIFSMEFIICSFVADSIKKRDF